MLNFWEQPLGKIFSAFRSGATGLYNFGFNIIHGSTEFNRYYDDVQKLAAILANPAALKVIGLQCDLFSMGRVSVEQNEKELESDPFLNAIKTPNPFSSQAQFLWDFMFWNMLGTAYCYVDSAIIDRPAGNYLYFLDHRKIEWPAELDRMKDKMIFSPDQLKKVMDTMITYRYDDGTTHRFPLSRLVMSFDLTNGIGNFYKGPSRIDALYKIISNSEHALDAKNINLRYSGKFLVGSPNEQGTTTKIGMSEDEKRDLATKIDTMEKRVWPLRSMIQIRRFVENMAQLQLDEALLKDYFLIGNMYNIPRDVLEMYNSATYENQEKARAAHVNYTLDPKGNQFMDAFERHFGYDKQGKNIFICWDHLPFMQVFEKEKAETKQIKIDSLTSLLQMGVPIKEANEFLDLDFTIEKKEDEERTNQDQPGGPEGGEEEGAGEGSAEE